MFTFRKMTQGFAVGLLALFAANQANSQTVSQLILPWQEPQERDPADVVRIMGEIKQKEPSRDLNILWVWGIDQFHDRWKFSHEYSWAMDRFCYDLLPHVPRVTITPVYYWPTQEQWDKADLAVFYLWPSHDGASGFKNGTEPEGDIRSVWDYDTIDAYQKRGGALIFLHLAVMEIGNGVELAKRIGLSWAKGVEGVGTTTSGGVVTMNLTDAGKKSDIFKDFPAKFDLHDELYWPLAGDESEISILVTAQGSKGMGQADRYPQDGPPELDGVQRPVAWTKQVGKGKVFATILGHNWFAFNDPYYRLMLFRAMAWTMDESVEPFLPLVNMHLQD
ncbi:MAG: ThuA domain-containing protein [Candidatus Hydrogenedentes bacterium]|nr:ThuA domain-containing protein [Candidatus Hydrogenedentota bacterium]